MLAHPVGVLALKSIIPASMRHRLSRLVIDLGALPGVARGALAGRAPGGPPGVFYGLSSLPSSREFVHGGLVKVQRMQSRWPNTVGRFNTLYMVSSAMPPAARWWAALAKRRGATFIWNQNGTSSPAWEGGNWRETNDTMRPLLRAADHVFYQSEFCKQAADRFLGPPTGAWEVLHNSVDTRVFVPRPTPLPENPLMLLLGGNQSELYRFETAAATLGVLVRRGMDARLLVSGRLRWSRDPDRAMREAREIVDRERLADRVEFTGPYTQEEALPLLHRAHLLLHTKYNDPCPGIVIEALACGLPVVYSASGGVPELVGEEAGVGVPVESSFDRMIPPDPEALADGVERVRASLGRYSRAARDRAVERFDIEPWLARHAEVFERRRR
jgi:glycosyltransferase involved in cell wall biosynthesis